MKAERVAVVTLAALGLGVATYLGFHAATAGPAAVGTVDLTVAQGPDGVTTLQFLGDTMFGDEAQPIVDTAPGQLVAGVRAMVDGDVTIANAEGPISTARLPTSTTREYVYTSSPRTAGLIRSVGIDAANLGNNHSMDVGLVGLQDTQRILSGTGVAPFGAGVDRSEAERPLILHTSHGRIAVVALGEDFGRDRRATSRTPGVVVFSPQSIQRGYDLARAAGAQTVIAAVHWGDNYQPVVPEQRAVAQQLVDAGYDLVIGTGPHVVQPVELIEGVPVVWSLGNFVFTTPGRWASYGAEGFGLVLDLVIARDGVSTLSFRCLVTDNAVTRFRARPCSPAESSHVLAPLNPSIRVDGLVGTMPAGLSLRTAGP